MSTALLTVQQISAAFAQGDSPYADTAKHIAAAC